MPNEPDTHDDFKPTNKLENSGLTLKDLVEQVEICQLNLLNIALYFPFVVQTKDHCSLS